MYRPPRPPRLRADFKGLLPSFQETVVIGNFNIDLNRPSHDSDSLMDFCTSNHLSLIPFDNTHHTSSGIDHCIVSDLFLVTSDNQLPVPFLSNHDLIQVFTSIAYLLALSASASTQDSTLRFFATSCCLLTDELFMLSQHTSHR